MHWRASVLALLSALLLGVAIPSAAFDIESMPTPEMQRRYDGLTHELRCMQCQNNTIADSPVGLASDLRRDVAEMLVAGKTDDEIRAYMVQRYGNVILFTPPMSGSSAWVWVLPGLAAIGGLLIAVRIVRRRSNLVEQDDSIVDGEEKPS